MAICYPSQKKKKIFHLYTGKRGNATTHPKRKKRGIPDIG